MADLLRVCFQVVIRGQVSGSIHRSPEGSCNLLCPRQVGNGRQALDRHRQWTPLQKQFLENSRGQIGQLDHPTDVAVGDIFGLGHVSLSPSGLQDASVAWQAQNLNAAREAYLAYHRENVFLAG